MSREEFEKRLEKHGEWSIFRANAEELGKLRGNVSLGMWLDMVKTAGHTTIPGAVAAYSGVLFVEAEKGDLNKSGIPFLASIL